MPLVFEAKQGDQGAHPRRRLFQCCVNTTGQAPHCGPCSQCIAQTARGQRCGLITCKLSDYCHIHLKKLHHVVLGPSRAVPGDLGLFAGTRANIAAAERANRNPPVFKKGHVIVPYGGKVVDVNRFDDLYDYKDAAGRTVQPTAPYGLYKSKTEVFDAACMRKAGPYVNDSRGTGLTPNAELTKSGSIRALKNIYKGEEILVNYRQKYWRYHGPNWLRYSTRYVKPRRTAAATSGAKGRYVQN